ncbi:hypothetical protein VRU48_09735 [Pedobacter sp. KR3-3]|uniref:Uncharacterized protein n=1 Tax=Pedobacter albus TaxID=3113905 RepID=A0ABU7I7D4_9SPHI|nr:hypothetical protein [Pedobacter sp. KR3-3]MEE1945389.1 hypothetical protein [Pedobacter sp. KR3-3]
MDVTYYLNKFKGAADKLDNKQLHQKQLETAVGEVLDSVFLKLHKKSWASPFQDPLIAQSRIFFSVWINDEAVDEQKILYNIHAFKLRQLPGYVIQSRKFADLFRAGFKNFAHEWPNVSVAFGPLTLMEGWIKLDAITMEDDILKLANNFLAIEHLVDDTLAHFKNKQQ